MVGDKTGYFIGASVGNETGKSNGTVGLGGTPLDGVGRSHELQGTSQDHVFPVGVEAVHVLSGGPVLNSAHSQCSFTVATSGKQYFSMMPPSRPR